jgi:hypothetical protein
MKSAKNRPVIDRSIAIDALDMPSLDNVGSLTSLYRSQRPDRGIALLLIFTVEIYSVTGLHVELGSLSIASISTNYCITLD